MLQETELFSRNEACLITLILLVEDDHANAQLFTYILSRETPYNVFWVTNGLAALHFTEYVKPELFLLDYYLPDMNGILLYDQLHARKELEAVPAIIVGASLEEAGDDIKQRGLPAVGKPFDLDEFLSTIESVLASSSDEH
jgi:DNA-binding response OmpR family regulator